MSTVKTNTSLALAATAAAMFALAPLSASAEGDKVHCMGVNSCKGQSSCATASSSCKGLNSCKGQGWVELTKEQCAEQGGKVAG